MSSSDASPTPNGAKLKNVFKGLKPRGAAAEARAERLLEALEAAAFAMIMEPKGDREDLRVFAKSFGKDALERRLSAAGPDSLTGLLERLDPKRRRFPKATAELVELALKKVGKIKEPVEQGAKAEPTALPTRDAIFAYTDEASLRADLEGYSPELLKRIRLEHGLMYSALPPPKDKKGEIEHIVASVFRRPQGSILDQMEFSPRARSLD